MNNRPMPSSLMASEIISILKWKPQMGINKNNLLAHVWCLMCCHAIINESVLFTMYSNSVDSVIH